MKRVALRRRQAPQRKTPLRAKSELRRRVAIRKRNPARLARLQAIQYGKKAKWIRTLPCVACGETPVQAHHVATKGAGGTSEDLAPLCLECHDLFHNVGRWTFDRMARINLVAEATRLHGVWLTREERGE